jgi:hypothetical protein
MAARSGPWYPGRVTRRLLIAFSLCLACARLLRADAGLLPDGHLDTAAVRDGYLRADMPFVRATLERFAKIHPREAGPAEKVFTHLYLGAIYAGEANGRARAEAHFRAALRLDPYSDPANLYLPPATKTWFERLRADVLRAQAEVPADETGPAEPAPSREGAVAQARPQPPLVPAPAPDRETGSFSAPTAAPSSASTAVSTAASPAPEPSLTAAPASRGWLWWTLGTAAAAAAGVGTFAWIETNSKPTPRRVQVDATLK